MALIVSGAIIPAAFATTSGGIAVITSTQ